MWPAILCRARRLLICGNGQLIEEAANVRCNDIWPLDEHIVTGFFDKVQMAASDATM